MLYDSIKSHIKPVALLVGSDESANETVEIDTRGFNSGVVSILWKSTLASDETIKFRVEIASGITTGFSRTYSDLQAITTVYTDPTAGATYTAITLKDIDIGSLNRYIMLRITATTSVGSGNVNYGATLILGGASTKATSLSFTSTPV